MIWICILAGVTVYIIIHVIFKSCYELTVLHSSYCTGWQAHVSRGVIFTVTNACNKETVTDDIDCVCMAVDFCANSNHSRIEPNFIIPAFYHLLHFIIPYSNATNSLTYTSWCRSRTHVRVTMNTISIKFRVVISYWEYSVLLELASESYAHAYVHVSGSSSVWVSSGWTRIV